LITGECCENVKIVANSLKKVYYIDLQNILDPNKDFGCNSHPSVSGHTKTANIVIPQVKKVLNWN